MISQNAAKDEEIRQKLKVLERHLPSQHDIVYVFGEFLAGRFNSEASPEKFVRTCQIAVYDLQAGVDSVNRRQIIGQREYPAVIFNQVMTHVPAIAATVFSRRFARKVERVAKAMSAGS